MLGILRYSFTIVASLCAVALGGERAFGQVLQGEAAYGSWHDDRPGLRRLLTLQDLPPIEKPTYGLAQVVPIPTGARPQVPDGFSVELVTSALRKPRVIREAPNGDLFVADTMFNAVHVLRIPPGGAKPARDEVFASGLKQPFGIAFYPLGSDPRWVYIANSDGVVRFRYRNGQLKATGKPERIVAGIPTTHHYARDIAFSADGRRLFFSVGSGSNAAQDMFPEPHLVMHPSPRIVGGIAEWSKTEPLGAAWDTEELRADVLSFDPDGTHMQIVATGLRNCEGMTVQPATGELWCIVNERDELGDNTPFEYATHVIAGEFYGWPWYFIGGHEDPRHAGARPDLKDQVTVPDVLMQAHSAPLQMVFYQGDNFPPEYKGSAFAAMHGSWNRVKRTGYKVVRLLFDAEGKPTGEYEDFMTGFVLSDSQVWGRPVGVAVARDGSLIMTEDGNGTIWRVTYRGGTRTASDAGESTQTGFDAAKGGDLYIANCSACHLANGEGIPGAFPPLKGSGVVNKDDAVKHIQVVLNGMQGARAGGVVYASAMPPFAGVLSDAEIADIIDYERASWGNHGTPVNAAQVAAERARAK
jgi:glucose/arabinose dehydrogenase